MKKVKNLRTKLSALLFSATAAALVFIPSAQASSLDGATNKLNDTIKQIIENLWIIIPACSVCLLAVAVVKYIFADDRESERSVKWMKRILIGCALAFLAPLLIKLCIEIAKNMSAGAMDSLLG